MDNINNNTTNTKTNTSEYESLRKEWDNGLGRTIAKMNLGNVCYNCGCTEAVELHHVVPLKFGGTNNLSNIVALCHRCHMAAHYGRHMRDYCNKQVSGRPHKVPDEEYKKAIEDYINIKIGGSECKSRMGVCKKTHIADTRHYKETMKKLGIEKIRNNIDLIRKRRGYINKGDEAGYVIYNNGDVINIYYGE